MLASYGVGSGLALGTKGFSLAQRIPWVWNTFTRFSAATGIFGFSSYVDYLEQTTHDDRFYFYTDKNGNRVSEGLALYSDGTKKAQYNRVYDKAMASAYALWQGSAEGLGEGVGMASFSVFSRWAAKATVDPFAKGIVSRYLKGFMSAMGLGATEGMVEEYTTEVLQFYADRNPEETNWSDFRSIPV